MVFYILCTMTFRPFENVKFFLNYPGIEITRFILLMKLILTSKRVLTSIKLS